MQAITLTASAFSLSIATPGGQPIRFSDADDVSENTRRWLAEFSARPLSKPLRLEDVDRRCCLHTYVYMYICGGSF